MGIVIRDAADWSQLQLDQYHRPAPVRGVLVCPPDAFDVIDVRNVHMEDHVGAVDRDRARAEWQGMVDAFAAAGLSVEQLPADRALVDMVFTANPCLTGVDRRGEPFALLSRMRHEARRPEVSVHEAWFREAGIRIVGLPPEFDGAWEGGGDAIWHPNRTVLWAGFGERSDPAVYDYLAERLDIAVALVRLVDPAFYHLDTCLAVIDERRAAWLPSAFDDDGRALIEAGFDELIEVDGDEGANRLAANLYCPNGDVVFLPSGSPRTRERLEDAGLRVVEVQTDEYLKSGGSIYCMRQSLYHEV